MPKQEDLISLARVYVPEVNSDVISDANVLIILNIGAEKFVAITEAFPKNVTFKATAETQEYNLSEFVTDFQKMTTSGLWWLDSNGNWNRLKPTTLRVLDDEFPQWRSDSSASPFRYFINGNVITIHPKPDTTLADAFKLYYFARSTNMSDSTHYPFTGSTTRDPFLVDFEEDIIEYYKYRAKQIMGYDGQAREAKESFIGRAQYAKTQLQDRPDIATEAHVRPVANLQHYKHAFGTTVKRGLGSSSGGLRGGRR